MNELEQLKATFREEAEGSLVEISELLSAVSKNPNDEGAFASLRRVVHNLKGAALTVGERQIAEPCNALEMEHDELCARGQTPENAQLVAWTEVISRLTAVVRDARLSASHVDSETSGAPSPRPQGPRSSEAGCDQARCAAEEVHLRIPRHRLHEVEVCAQVLAASRARITQELEGLRTAHHDNSTRAREGDSASAWPGGAPELLGIIERLQDLGPALDVLGAFVNELSKQTSARPKRVVVIDDSLIVRTVETQILEAGGFEVSACSDGSEAWNLLEHGEFDLVVCDVQMPDLDGFQLTTRIRATEPIRSLPVILVTGRSSPNDIAQAARVGADGYIVKDELNEATLLDAARRLLHL